MKTSTTIFIISTSQPMVKKPKAKKSMKKKPEKSVMRKKPNVNAYKISILARPL